MPNWKKRIDVAAVWRNDSLDFPTRAHRIADIVERSCGDEVAEIVEGIRNAADDNDPDEFDVHWNDFYDYCDFKRYWVATF